MSTVTRLDYCQFWLVSQTNYTLTYFADHSPGFSHHALKRYWEEEKLTARLVGENVKGQVVSSPQGYLAFDDTVLDHNSAFKIDLVRRQYTGNAPGVVKEMGVVTCIDINPEQDRFWILDYRIDDPDHHGKSKLDHVRQLLANALSSQQLPFRGVLMDTGYAERKLMLHIQPLGKVYYCPLKSNRQVDDSAGQNGYQPVDSLTWTETEQQQGKHVHIKDFPKGHQVNRLRLVFSTESTDYIATNDGTHNSAPDTQEVCGLRWKIEPFHRETQPTTGIEGCQCRLARIQPNHSGCAILVWVRLKQVAQETASTLYQLKQGLLDDYLRSQLRSPAIKIQLA
jgi:DDE family transposase